MSAQVAQGAAHLLVGEVGQQGVESVDSRGQPVAERGERGAQQELVLLVAHRVDALAQGRTTRPVEQRASASRRTSPRAPASPAAANMPCHRLMAMSGTIRSSDCRLRSTTHSTSPSRCTIGSATHSQIAPSSSSASPDQGDLPATGLDAEVGADVAAGDRPPHRAPWRRCRPSRSSSPAGPGPWCARGRAAAHRAPAAVAGTTRRAVRAGSSARAAPARHAASPTPGQPGSGARTTARS